MMLTRRVLLAGATSLAAGGLLMPRRGGAAAPTAGRQVPGAYRVKVGAIEVTALLDGHLELEPADFPRLVPSAAQRLLDDAFLGGWPLRIPVNAYLVNDGARLALIDTGTSNTMGPTVGHLPASLTAAGIDPASIDIVLLTHMHPDHANGLLTPAGAVAFPNAEVVAAADEAAFWLAEDALGRAGPGARRFEMAQKALKPYAARLRRVTPGGEVAPGITSIGASGHTPGHTAYRVASGNDQLLIWGDTIHAAALQFAHPDWSSTFDHDRAQAEATRSTLLDMAATDRIAVAGMHLPFPGIGHVARSATAYSFVPAPWQPAL